MNFHGDIDRSNIKTPITDISKNAELKIVRTQIKKCDIKVGAFFTLTLSMFGPEGKQYKSKDILIEIKCKKLKRQN